MSEPLLPPSLTERYRPERLLGEGGFGRVVLATDLQLERPVAVKLLHQVDPEQAARMEREAKVAAALRHPHVVELLDHGVLEDGAPYLVTSFIEGEDLLQRCERQKPSHEELATWARQVGEALAAAHEAGIVHRDVKPENVMRTDSGDTVLCDFGLARSLEGSTFATQEGLITGTPEYMAPELWLGEQPSAASDQWAWAATLQVLRGGAPPYPDPAPGAIFKTLNRGFRPPMDCPAGLARALDPDPSQRFPDMHAAVEAVARELAEGRDPLRGSQARLARTVASTPSFRPGEARGGTRSLSSFQVAPPAPRRRGPVIAASAATTLLLLGATWVAMRPDAPLAPTPPGPPPPTQAPPDGAPAPAAPDAFPGLTLTPELRGALATLDEHREYLSARILFTHPRLDNLEPLVVSQQLQTPWWDLLENLPEQFARHPDEHPTHLVLFDYLEFLSDDLFALTSMGNFGYRLQSGQKIEDLAATSHDDIIARMFEQARRAYIDHGDPAGLSDADLVLRAMLCSNLRPLRSAIAPLEAELLARARRGRPMPPWVALGMVYVQEFTHLRRAEHEDLVRGTLGAYTTRPAPAGILEATAALRLAGWLISNRERDLDEVIRPEDSALVRAVVDWVPGHLSHGVPATIHAIHDLEVYLLSNLVNAGRLDEVEEAFWRYPAITHPREEPEQPVPGWHRVAVRSHLQHLANRLAHADAPDRPETQAYLDEALRILESERSPIVPAGSTEYLQASANALQELAERLGDSPRHAPLRERMRAFALQSKGEWIPLVRQLAVDTRMALGTGPGKEEIDALLQGVGQLMGSEVKGPGSTRQTSVAPPETP